MNLLKSLPVLAVAALTAGLFILGPAQSADANPYKKGYGYHQNYYHGGRPAPDAYAYKHQNYYGHQKSRWHQQRPNKAGYWHNNKADYRGNAVPKKARYKNPPRKHYYNQHHQASGWRR